MEGILPQNPLELLDFLKKKGMLNKRNAAICLDSLSEPGSQKLFRECLDELAPEIIRMQLTCSPFNVPGEEVDGLLRFASTETGRHVGWPMDRPHTLMAGSSTTGKTTAYLLMAREALKYGHKAWFFVRADDVTSLIRIFPDIFYDDCRGMMKINPLIFLSPEIFTSVFNDSFVLYEGSEAYLLEVIMELKAKNPEPNLYDLYYFIRAKSHPALSRTARYRESLLNRLGGLLKSSLGKTYDCVRGHEDDIAKNTVIFNIAGLTLSGQKFIVNSLLLFLYSTDAEKMRVVVLDDASLLLQNHKELTLIDDILSNIRKGCIHIIACSQFPAELSPGILSNISNKMVFYLSSGIDRKAMQDNLGVSDANQKEHLCAIDSKKHEVIIELAGIARPCVAFVYEAGLPKRMSKSEIYAHAEKMLEGYCKPVSRIREEQKEEKFELRNEEREWLMAVYLNQYRKTLTEIHDITGFSGCKGTRIAKELEKSGMIKIVSIVKGRGVSKFPVLLAEAYKILNLEEKKFYGKGAGYEHVVWQHLIAGHFRECKPVIELNKNGKFIDVAFEHEGRLIAIEIAMTSLHEKENIEKDIGIAKADFVIIGCKDKKVKEEVMQIIKELPEEMRNKTSWLLLSEILKSALSELINHNKNQEEQWKI